MCFYHNAFVNSTMTSFIVHLFNDTKGIVNHVCLFHYNDVMMGVVASQITSLTIVYSIVYSGADRRKHQSSATLAFVRRIHRSPVNSLHKWPVTWKMSPFDDVIMCSLVYSSFLHLHMHSASMG